MPNPKKIVCLGGGTGVSVVLSGLKKYPLDLSAVVTMFDNGGSSGRLRKEMGILPLGDLRQCLLATSERDNLVNLFQYRFAEGKLKGHSFGNLFIAATSKAVGSLEEAINQVGETLNAKAKVVPVTLENSDIKAELKNRKKMKGEEAIINCQHLSKVGLKKLTLEPKVKANPKAISTIKKADLIVIGPGKFYTSLLPIFLVEGIKEAIKGSRAKKVFICNLMTQVGNTDNFTVENFVSFLEQYLGKDAIDYVIFNTGRLPASLEKETKKVFPKARFINYDNSLLKKKNFIGVDVLDRSIHKSDPADILVKGANLRTMILHDSDKLTKVILSLCKQ